MRGDGQFDAWVQAARGVRIEAEIARRGIKLNGNGAERIGPCPMCGGTDRFSINTKKQVWNCRGCAKGGDVIDLTMHCDGGDFIAACATLAGPPPKANGKGNSKGTERSKKVVAAAFEYHDEAGNILFVVRTH